MSTAAEVTENTQPQWADPAAALLSATSVCVRGFQTPTDVLPAARRFQTPPNAGMFEKGWGWRILCIFISFHPQNTPWAQSSMEGSASFSWKREGKRKQHVQFILFQYQLERQSISWLLNQWLMAFVLFIYLHSFQYYFN